MTVGLALVAEAGDLSPISFYLPHPSVLALLCSPPCAGMGLVEGHAMTAEALSKTPLCPNITELETDAVRGLE